MSFYFSFVAKSKERALQHIEDLQNQGAFGDVPEPVWKFVYSAVMHIQHGGLVSVTATGHLATVDRNRYGTSTCQIEVKHLDASSFVE
jgi:hypothetical protein